VSDFLNIHWMDHALVAYLTVLMPLQALAAFRSLESAIAVGDPNGRLRAYRNVLLRQWSVALLTVVVWLRMQRPLADLGLGWGEVAPWRTGLAWTLVAVGVTLLLRQSSLVRREKEARAAVEAQLQPIAFLLPHRGREMRRFRSVAITAGICEELLFRGFLIWYLAVFLGLAGAIVGSALIFGLGHAYQGTAGILKTGVIGLVMAGLYVLSGSLLPPMLLHAATDLVNGQLAHAILRQDVGMAEPLATEPGGSDA
jgi:membrane protease YdiL (CAAX protease family)